MMKIADIGDYKIIKSVEYDLCGKPCPYNMDALHIERQGLRDLINSCNNELSSLQERGLR